MGFGFACALLELRLHVLTGLDAQTQIAHPGAVLVGHADDLEDPGPHLRWGHPAGEAIVALGLERRFPTAGPRSGVATGPAMADPRHDHVMPIGEDAGADRQRQP